MLCHCRDCSLRVRIRLRQRQAETLLLFVRACWFQTNAFTLPLLSRDEVDRGADHLATHALDVELRLLDLRLQPAHAERRGKSAPPGTGVRARRGSQLVEHLPQ